MYSKLEHIRAWVEEFCNNEAMSAYHAIWYGATLAIWVVQKGQVVQCVDLYDHIKVRLRGKGPIPLADRDACLALVRGARNAVPVPEEEAEDDDWDDDDIDALDEMELEFSWVEISAKLPPLEAPLIQPGQEIRIKLKKKPAVPTYVESGVFTYGSEDHEGGGEIDPPFDMDEAEDEEDE